MIPARCRTSGGPQTCSYYEAALARQVGMAPVVIAAIAVTAALLTVLAGVVYIRRMRKRVAQLEAQWKRMAATNRSDGESAPL